jgi:hypothetical protein
MTGTAYSTRATRTGVLRMLVLSCPLVLLISAAPALAQNLDFTLKNRLGVTIREVYVSPHQVNKWEEDVLGKDKVLPDGKDITIRFPPHQANRGDLWDLKVVTTNGTSYTWTQPGFRLSALSEITLYLNQGKATADSK